MISVFTDVQGIKPPKPFKKRLKGAVLKAFARLLLAVLFIGKRLLRLLRFTIRTALLLFVLVFLPFRLVDFCIKLNYV